MKNLTPNDIAAYAGNIERTGDGLVLAQMTDSDGVEWRVVMIPVANTLSTPAFSVQGLAEWEESGVRKREWREADAYYILSDACDHFCAIVNGLRHVETHGVAADAGQMSRS